MQRQQSTLINPLSTKAKRRALRKPLTHEELQLWQAVRNRQLLGRYFRRQHGMGCYIVDFCCVSERLVIELDGSQHYTPEALIYDAERTRFLSGLGYRVLRFSNDDVRQSMAEVLWQIAAQFRG